MTAVHFKYDKIAYLTTGATQLNITTKKIIKEIFYLSTNSLDAQISKIISQQKWQWDKGWV